MIFGFLGEKLSLDYVINTKSQSLPVNIFFRKIYFLAQKQVATKKGIKNFLPQIFVFLFEKKMHIIQFSYMKTL